MLTILTLNILLMIVYLSHWDWNLYKSRKDIVLNLDELNIKSICPEGIYTKELKTIYQEHINWKIDREKTFDFKGVINLKNILNSLEGGTIVHSFTLKTGILQIVDPASEITIGSTTVITSNTVLGRFLTDNIESGNDTTNYIPTAIAATKRSRQVSAEGYFASNSI